MRKLAFVILFISSISVGAAGIEDESMRFKDGSHLFIRDDDTMHMQDKDGNPMTMKEDVVMEMEDGTFIMMKNKKIWHHYDFKKKWRHKFQRD